MDTIRLYDINDYKTKTELTRTRLFTTLMVAIRSYQQLRQVEATRQGLESIISASMDLSRLRGLKSFAEGVVIQLCALLGVQNEGPVCALSTSERFDPLVVAASRRYADMIGQPLSHCAPAHQRSSRCCTRRCASAGALPARHWACISRFPAWPAWRPISTCRARSARSTSA